MVEATTVRTSRNTAQRLNLPLAAQSYPLNTISGGRASRTCWPQQKRRYMITEADHFGFISVVPVVPITAILTLRPLELLRPVSVGRDRRTNRLSIALWRATITAWRVARFVGFFCFCRLACIGSRVTLGAHRTWCVASV